MTNLPGRVGDRYRCFVLVREDRGYGGPYGQTRRPPAWPPVQVESHPADWKTHGKAAGPIRNQAMVDAGADVCLAFILPGSRGTADCVRRAEAAGIPVRIFEAGS